MQKLIAIQNELKAPKNQINRFGNYSYRSAEDILEAVKPLLKAYGCLLYLSDTIEHTGGRNYVRATATFTDGEFTLSVSASAREEETKKGMDGSQITGAASSYARKYALNGLFLIDDNKDSDSTNQHDKQEKPSLGELNESHKHWEQVVQRLSKGEASIDKLKEYYTITKEIENKLKTYTK